MIQQGVSMPLRVSGYGALPTTRGAGLNMRGSVCRHDGSSRSKSSPLRCCMGAEYAGGRAGKADGGVCRWLMLIIGIILA